MDVLACLVRDSYMIERILDFVSMEDLFQWPLRRSYLIRRANNYIVNLDRQMDETHFNRAVASLMLGCRPLGTINGLTMYRHPWWFRHLVYQASQSKLLGVAVELELDCESNVLTLINQPTIQAILEQSKGDPIISHILASAIQHKAPQIAWEMLTRFGASPTHDDLIMALSHQQTQLAIRITQSLPAISLDAKTQLFQQASAFMVWMVPSLLDRSAIPYDPDIVWFFWPHTLSPTPTEVITSIFEHPRFTPSPFRLQCALTYFGVSNHPNREIFICLLLEHASRRHINLRLHAKDITSVLREEVCSNNLERVTHLLESGDYFDSNKVCVTASFRKGHFDVILDAIARTCPAEAIYYAAAYNVIDKVQAYAGDVNYHNPENGETPLYVATVKSHTKIIEYLAKHGARADIPTHAGETTYQWVMKSAKPNLIRFFRNLWIV